MKKILLFFTMCLGGITLFSQSIDTYKSLLEFSSTSSDQVLTVAPNFPLNGTDADLKEWIVKYETEVKAFLDIASIKAINPSYIDLGVEHLKPYIFRHYVWDNYNKLSDKQKNTLVHFPIPVLTGEYEKDFALYEERVSFWKIVYTPEYVELNQYINAEFIFSYQPKFIGKLVVEKKPVRDDYLTELDFILTLQNWYFVYHPQKFKSVFGFEPIFTSSLDLDEYRYKMMNPDQGVDADDALYK